MGFKVYFFVLMVLSVYVVQSFAFPRDGTAFQDEHEKLPTEDSILAQKALNPTKTITEPIIPGRIRCQYEEATEDIVCQEHCIPKGYSYGLCISNTCSCI